MTELVSLLQSQNFGNIKNVTESSLKMLEGYSGFKKPESLHELIGAFRFVNVLGVQGASGDPIFRECETHNGVEISKKQMLYKKSVIDDKQKLFLEELIANTKPMTDHDGYLGYGSTADEVNKTFDKFLSGRKFVSPKDLELKGAAEVISIWSIRVQGEEPLRRIRDNDNFAKVLRGAVFQVNLSEMQKDVPNFDEIFSYLQEKGIIRKDELEDGVMISATSTGLGFADRLNLLD